LWCGPTTVNLKRKSTKVGNFSYDEVLARLKEELDKLVATQEC
jgi:(E)-4-hydroxy-3-methylbut-2-enyl-diphosphate synthase